MLPFPGAEQNSPPDYVRTDCFTTCTEELHETRLPAETINRKNTATVLQIGETRPIACLQG